jgi:hypothetical protein
VLVAGDAKHRSWSVAASPHNGLAQTFEHSVDRRTGNHPRSRDDDHVERLVARSARLVPTREAIPWRVNSLSTPVSVMGCPGAE